MNQPGIIKVLFDEKYQNKLRRIYMQPYEK